MEREDFKNGFMSIDNGKTELLSNEEKTPMQHLIEKIDLYDERGGINMFTLKAVLRSYLRFEEKYLNNIKNNKSFEDDKQN